MSTAVFWSEHLRLLRESILCQVARIRKGSQHSVIKGTSIEYLLRRLFEQYLPLRFSVGTGQVATAKGEVSPQMDLMIYDRTTFPHLSSNEDGSIVVCCESVYGCIEVKTRWDHADVQKHFSGFSRVDAQRDPHFNISSSEDAASYTVVLIEKLDRFDWEWSDLKDQSRQVLVTSLEGDKVWHSEWVRVVFEKRRPQTLLKTFSGNFFVTAYARNLLNRRFQVPSATGE